MLAKIHAWAWTYGSPAYKKLFNIHMYFTYITAAPETTSTAWVATRPK